ncbi:polysaccharide biosynthesis protein [Enterococcus hirae]|uniref:polysaccharide biosynthesis protein n=1 Tax=Enterococcus hirae TaxID=1354 RepID=UPI002542D6EB|nr:nucleoside-diphosphate sugar epimerase/dehydratase [Enterococcus hirae]MDK4469196.1 polysaccharide biosynthesis protein [Enterococcus hirae]
MFELTRKRKIQILVIVDSLLVAIANLATYYFMRPFLPVAETFVWSMTILSILLYLFYGFIFKVFTRINRYTNLREMIAIFATTTCQTLTTTVVLFFIDKSFSRIEVFTYIFSTFLIVTSRLAWRLYIEHRNMHSYHGEDSKRTLIIGAGEGGRILYNSLLGSKTARDIEVVGFVDDDPNKVKTYLAGIKVLGTTKQLPELIRDNNIDMVTIAIPSLSRKKLREIFDNLEKLKVKVTAMPSMEEMASGKISMERLKKIDVVDLLGREEVKLDIESIKDQLTDKVILVTGAGGSIGSEICRQVIQFNPKQLLLLGHGENSIYMIDRELKTKYADKMTEIIPIIADIQDRQKIFEIIEQYQPDIVYHAAAHKHVPMMEYNPREAVKNNIYGTKNVAEAAKANNVKNFVMISTDKANNPPNVMGSTKRISEMIVTGLNEPGKTKFSAVRFGNVLGSRGSVIPVFREQIAKGGPITVTDFRMTRYFMTIPEASRLVIQSGALAKGGEIFILDMSEPVKILDLAKNMVRLSGYSEDDIEIIETGIRPGEKLYEELLLDKERNDEEVFEKIFVGNIKGFSIDEVMDFVEHLSKDDKELAKEVVRFANASNK